jgi:2'-5' RNA ligase
VFYARLNAFDFLSRRAGLKNMGKRKYFIAIILRDQALAQAEGVKQEIAEKFGVKGALRSPAHITLHRPFEWKEENEPLLREKLRSFKTDGPLDIKLQGCDAFSKRVIYFGVQADDRLRQLHSSLKSFARRELGLLNEWDDTRGFHPHVTVAFRDLKTKNFQQVWDFVQAVDFSHKMIVSGFSLLRLEQNWEELEYFDFSDSPERNIYKASK